MQEILNKNPYRQAQFLLSAAKYHQLPAEQGQEVAFAGHSNVGKSSVINVLTEQRSLARTSKTPGRTQHLVCFTIDDTRRLIDLPGYGYARVDKKTKQHWAREMECYFQQRQSLIGLVLIMDIRHPLKEFDRQMIDWCAYQQLPLRILLNKADKLSNGAAKNTLLSVQSQLPDNSSIQLFSAKDRQGVNALIEQLNDWFG